jgi:RNA polymerase sigma-54 factor
VPDVYVYKLGGEYVVVLNEDGMPKLRISDFYRQRLLTSNDTAPEAKEYIVNKMHQAAWLIRSIHQRQRTLYKVAASIVKFQREFLEHGISHLKPLVLKDVAEDVGVHESTVSRVTANKYMHTPRGIFEFKFFFSAGLKKEEGDWVASETVRFAIRDIINSEDPRHPLNDEKIAEKLKERGFKIARRTVTKYRESLNIPPSSKRKRFE